MQITAIKILTVSLLCMVYFQAAKAQPFNVLIRPMVIPPVSSHLSQILSSYGTGIRVSLQTTGSDALVYISGRLERISAPQFSITLKQSAGSNRKPTPKLVTKMMVFLSTRDIEEAFGNLDENSLKFDPPDVLNKIKDGLNYVLPEGTYRICFWANYANGQFAGRLASDSVNMGCVLFTICYKAAAPQFIQPVNNLSFNASITTIRPRSPLVFTWTPPRAICGTQLSGLTYDLEIREILDNQSITDALNNPFVFQKRFLPSSTFLLDTNLYKNILQEGSKYIIRVKANKANSRDSAVIDNNGYSRIEAFRYGDESVVKTKMPAPQSLFINFRERNADYWQKAYDAYQKGLRKDTLVPIKEYIPLMLTKGGIAYNYDAIELFMALNPDLYEGTEVYLSRTPNLPDLPKLSDSDRASFDAEHALSVLPDTAGGKGFTAHLDSLQAVLTGREYPDVPKVLFNNFVNRLSVYNRKVDTENRVAVKFLNLLLSQLIADISAYPVSLDNQQLSHLQKLIADADEIMALPDSKVSLQYKNQQEMAGRYPKKSLAAFTGYRFPAYENVVAAYRPFASEQPRQFKIIVWHYTKDQPNKPVDNAPELKGSYKIYYTSPAMYDPKYPALHATTLNRPASVAQVSLINATFLFWTENRMNHKTTEAQAVYPMDLYLNSLKPTAGKKSVDLTIVLKVE